MKTRKRQIISFDILRIFACMSVFAVHTAIFLPVSGILGSIMEAGSSGLNIFFVLSGFLTYDSIEKSKNLKEWYVKRFIRIMPVYYIVLVLNIIFYELLVKTVPQDSSGIGWLRYFLCINKIIPSSDIFWVNLGAISSITVFIWFYILAPFFQKIIRSLKASVKFFIGCYCVARLLLYFTEWFSVFSYFYYFAIGIIVYYAVKESKERIVMLCGLIMVGGLLLLKAQGGLTYAIVVGLIMIASYESNIANSKLRQIIVSISKLTFCFWLGHGMVMDAMEQVYKGSYIGKLFCFLGLSILLTLFLYVCVEKTIVHVVYRHINRHKSGNDQ